MRLTAACLGLLWAAQAQAFSSPFQFDTGPSADSTGGSAGIYYTGSPRFQGQDCAGCHQGDDSLSIAVSSLPGDLLGEPYRPGQVYHVEIDLLTDRNGPHRCPEGASDACNLNLFAVEIATATGGKAGELCPLPFTAAGCPEALGTPTVRTRDGTTLIANGLRFDAQGQPSFRDGQTAYDFYWRAPPRDVGALAMWIAAVDGDGGAATPDSPADPYNDTTGVFRLQLCGPSGCPKPAGAGCQSAPTPGAPFGPALGLAGLLAALALTRRRTASRRIR